ncbi:MAG: GTPase Era [Candidatus Brocadia sp. AMX2]|uniref:GTPase Era n=1 Tax=Candidatus Brocadia sinica JPN1 TaxID=1197129 RepID=A0ABQ0JUC7_9BACT|nr:MULTISPECIES: GTPase Era [Brocadia]MBC6932956.1 GTPase Era [Candidatus Brocadia sp.]MBL1169262.1 GTPase Era [Candidatus Brocadia sp. AMX1]NOG41762.1 GTPase Era [Planctomycetota bacterium]GIK14101.1 MAG: GTPase Era [Candidatus Brocadia sinica]KAA0241902.1 MAG: GTPase Era [Candidatus Brocadia sp. AMX2]
MQSDKKTFKAGYVAIVGKPNVGKSTLINDFMGCKLSIVTPKPQTTRKKIMGVLTREGYQIVFYDTPGIMDPKYELQEYMVRTAYNAIEDADVILLMAEPFEPPNTMDKAIFEKLLRFNIPVILAVNKVDLVEKDSIIPIISAYDAQFKFAEIVPISALKGMNLDLTLTLIEKYLPEGEPFYPEDYMTDYNERFLASEIIREKVFEFYGEEIPYSTTVEIEEFKEREAGKDYIKAIIYVERDSQKGIIIGKEGKAIKRVGLIAREEIEKQIGRKVYLELRVKVMEKWRKDKNKLYKLGYK